MPSNGHVFSDGPGNFVVFIELLLYLPSVTCGTCGTTGKVAPEVGELGLDGAFRILCLGY